MCLWDFLNFKCDICNEKFKNEKSMKNHIKRMGGRESGRTKDMPEEKKT